MLCLALNACSNIDRIRTADLVFVLEQVGATEAGGMSSAIADATSEGADFCATHVGIMEVCGDSLYVIDATPEHGVARRPLSEFTEEFSPFSTFSFMRVKGYAGRRKAVEKAKSFIGHEYDFTFLPENGMFYCSELIQVCFTRRDGHSLFPGKPMNFRDSSGKYPEYWQNLFSNMGIPVPQGVPGTNPNDLMHDACLRTVSNHPCL